MKQEKINYAAAQYSERICNGQFPIEYSREQVVKHTSNDFIEGAEFFRKHVLSVLKENSDASKELTDEDKERSAQDILIETYNDLIEIFKPNP